MAKKLNYLVGFTADTNELKSALSEVQRSLLTVSSLSTGKPLTQDMQLAARAAQELSGFLQLAINQSTGRLDLSKFNSSLKQSGLTLKLYADRLLAIGPDGEKAFLNVASAISKAELPLMRTNKLLDELWVTMKNTMRWQLTSSAFHGFMGAVSTAYGYTKDLNSSLNSIQIVTEKSTEDMSKFAELANKAALALSTTTVDYTDASLIYYQQGLDDAAVEGRTATTIKLANVARESAEDASEQMTAIWNNFYDGSKSLEYYADVMTALGASTASSTQEISAGLQKFAAIAQTVGLSYEYAASALATITATTRESADVVGTSLRTLFARILGLTQDETQDDGTTLNKYSKALAEVGINIKDTSGEMKEMNVILDEMGAKWGTLSKSQQMALAQTVAGVRQYTQLIALMENWDFFQENLVTAMGSEGSLEKLAQIYAKSWEAARDRVRAAAEDIYDSIVNPEAYIDMDNILTPFLNGVASAIDAVGGLKGMLITAGYAVTTLYGDKIAQSMRDAAYNISLLTGKEMERQRAIKETAAALAEQMALDSANINEKNINDTQLLALKVALQVELNKHAKEFSSIQYEQFENEIQLVDAIGKAALAYGEQMQAAETSADTMASELLLSDKTISTLSKKKANTLYNSFKKEFDTLASKQGITIDLNKIIKIEDIKNIQEYFNLDNLLTGFRQLNSQLGTLLAITQLLQGLSGEFDITNPKVQLMAEEFKKLTGKDLNLSSLKDALTQIENESSLTTEEISILLNTLAKFNVPTTVLNTIALDSLVAGNAMLQAKSSTDMYKEAINKLTSAILNALKPALSWADIVVGVSRLLASLGMMMQSIQNLGSIWKNEDLTAGEKIVLTLTSLGMLIPTVTSLISAATKATVTHTMATVAGTDAASKKIIADKLASNLKIIETQVINGNTVAVIENTAAWYANPMLWVVAGITAIVAIFTVYNNSLQENTRRLEENTEKAQEHVDALKEESKLNSELIASYLEALNIYSETGENKDLLDGLTRNLAEAFDLEGDALARVSGRYEDYNALLDEANEKQLRLLELELEANNRLASAAKAQAIDVATNLSQGPGATTFDWNFGEDINGIARLAFKEHGLRNIQRDDYGFRTTSFSETDMDSIVQVYDTAVQIQEKLQELGTSEALTSELYKNASNYIDKFSESVGKYKQAVEDANRIKLLLEVDDSGVDTLEKYREYVQELKDKGATEELIELVTQGATNFNIQQFDELEKAITRVKDVSLLADDTIESIFNNTDYDTDILKSLPWELIRTEKAFNDAYDSAKLYSDALLMVELDEANVTGASTILSNLQDGKLSKTELKELPELLTWGKNGIAELSEFLEMTTYEQQEYLQQMLFDGAKTQVEGIQNAINAATTLMEVFKTELENLYNDQAKLEELLLSIDERLSDTNLSYGLRKSLLDAKEEIQDLLSLTIDKIETSENAIKNLQDEIDSKAGLLHLNVKMQVQGALDYADGDISELSKLYNKGKISLEAYNQAFETLMNTLDTDVDAEKHKRLTKVLLQEAKAYKDIADSIEEDREGAAGLAEEFLRFDNAVESVNKNYKSWLETLQSEQGLLATDIETIEGLRNAYADALDLEDNGAGLSMDFLSSVQNLQLLQDAINGVDGAYEQLLEEVGKDVLIRAGIDDSELLSKWQELTDFINNSPLPDLEAGASIDNTEFISGLEEMINQMGLTADLASNLLDALGIEAEVTTLPATTLNVSTTVAAPNIDSSLSSQEQAMGAILGGAASAAALGAAVTGNVSGVMRAVSLASRPYFTYATGNSTLLESPGAFGVKVKNARKSAGGGVKNRYSSAPRSGGSGGGGGKGGGGGGGSTKPGKQYEPEKDKTLDDIIDRYHELNREIERQNDLLEDTKNASDRAYGILKIKNLKKELALLEKQQENYLAKLKEAQGRWLPQDTARLKELFDNVQIKDNGELLNYEALEKQMIDKYNAEIALYNEQAAIWSTWTQDQQDAAEEDIEAWKRRKEAADKELRERQEALAQYESTRDVIQETTDALEDNARAIADNKLTLVEYRLEVVLDVKSMKDALREFDKQVNEIFGDALTHGLQGAKLDADLAEAEAAMYPEYRKLYDELIKLYNSAETEQDRARIIEDIKDLQGKVLDSAEAIVEWVNSIEDIIPNAVDAARERFELFTNQLEHNTTVLDTIKELYTLQGVTYKTMDGFNRLQKVSQERLEAQVAQSLLNKAWYDEARENLEMAQARLDSLNGDETDLRYDAYKKARDAYLAEFNQAEEAYLSLAQQAMETAQEMYMEQLEKAVYDFGQVVSGGIGLDLLQDKYDHYIEKDERYFDKVNEAYQTTAWYNKLQADIDKATNAATKERLKGLQEEINIRREGNKLSQYDLDILNAKYEVLKALMELEDAQNAKNQLQLVRDRQGNWNYQYTADPSQIEDALKDLLDAQNEWYNIAKQLVTDVTGEIVATWQECQDKIKEIYSDMTLTDEERADRAAEIYAYYTDKIKYLEEEKQVAIADMTEAGNQSLFTAAVVMGDELTDLTGVTSEDIKNLVEQGGESIIGLLTADNETIKNVIASNTGLIDLFDNVYAQDLNNMTVNTNNFESSLLTTLGKCEDDFNKYKDTVSSVAESTGTKLDDLDTKTGEVSDSTDELREKGLDAALALWDMVDAADAASMSYLDMAESIWKTVQALRDLAAEQQKKVEEEADLDNDDWEPGKPIEDETKKPQETPTPTPTPPPSDEGKDNKGKMGHDELVQLVYDIMLGNYDNNPVRRNLVEQKYPGMFSIAQDLVNKFLYTYGWGAFNSSNNRKIISDLVSKAGFDTGGYTGEFLDAKLAFLHSKELVLNKQDTKNLLDTIEITRDIFATIEKVLDGNGIAAMGLLAEKLSSINVAPIKDSIEQTIHIDSVEFPNATNADEIKEAFVSIADDAVQWARRSKE